MSIEDGLYEDAQRRLERAKELLEGGDELVLLGILYQDFARLARARDQLDEAAEFAALGVQFGEASCRKMPKHDMQTRGQAFRSYADALHVAAQIEESRNNPGAADTLFKEAIATIEQTSFEETRSEIIFNYAKALKERGEHKLAAEYYQMGFRSRLGSDAQRV
jgi:tetratricopeptide (TPR) repeat protein